MLKSEILKPGEYASIPLQVLSNTNLSSNAKVIFAAILNFLGENENCWPGTKRLRQITGLSDDTIGRAIKKLEKEGFLIKENRQPNTNLYTLNIPRPCGDIPRPCGDISRVPAGISRVLAVGRTTPLTTSLTTEGEKEAAPPLQPNLNILKSMALDISRGNPTIQKVFKAWGRQGFKLKRDDLDSILINNPEVTWGELLSPFKTAGGNQPGWMNYLGKIDQINTDLSPIRDGAEIKQTIDLLKTEWTKAGLNHLDVVSDMKLTELITDILTKSPDFAEKIPLLCKKVKNSKFIREQTLTTILNRSKNDKDTFNWELIAHGFWDDRKQGFDGTKGVHSNTKEYLF